MKVTLISGKSEPLPEPLTYSARICHAVRGHRTQFIETPLAPLTETPSAPLIETPSAPSVQSH